MTQKVTQQVDQLLVVAPGGVRVGTGGQLLAEYNNTDHRDHCRDNQPRRTAAGVDDEEGTTAGTVGEQRRLGVRCHTWTTDCWRSTGRCWRTTAGGVQYHGDHCRDGRTAAGVDGEEGTQQVVMAEYTTSKNRDHCRDGRTGRTAAGLMTKKETQQ